MTADTKKALREAVRELRELYYQWVAEDIRAYPHRSYAEIGKTYGISEGTVYQIARMNGLSRTVISGDGGEHDER